MIGIYEILNTINGKRYVGSSIDIKHRLSNHRNNLKKDKHSNKYLQAAWNKYGQESFEFKQILECRQEDLLMYEQLIIDGYKANDKKCGYNLRLVSGSNAGMFTTRYSHKSGDSYYRLTLVEPVRKRGRRWLWLCKCICGNTKVIDPIDIKKGHTKSCGCLQTERQIVWLKEQHKKGPWNKGTKTT